MTGAIVFREANARVDDPDVPVFLYEPGNGVRRMTVPEYVELVENPHLGRYKLIQVEDADLEAAGRRVRGAAARIRDALTATGQRDGSYDVCAAFRTVWHGVRGERLPI